MGSRGVTEVSDGKVLYFVRPDAKLSIAEVGSRPFQKHLGAIEDESQIRIRNQFRDLLEGIWPNANKRPA